MLKKPAISIILVLISALGAQSQYYYGGVSTSMNRPRTDYTVDSTGRLLFKKGDMGFTMQAGAVFASNFKGSSSFGTYAAPAFAYNVSSKFRIKAGVSVFSNFGDPYYSYYDNFGYPVLNSGTTTSAFVQGDYLLGNKLMISGILYKDFQTFNVHSTDPRYKAPETEGMILNLNYRPNNFMEFNASFEYGNGNRSMLNSPFYPGYTFPGGSPW